MTRHPNRVAIGLVGSTLDAGKGARRWRRWRPTVALAQHEGLELDRLELLYQPRFNSLAEEIAGDIAQVAPRVDVRLQAFNLRDPWDFEEVYGALHDFAEAYPFDLENEEYLVHITTGSHVLQICLFLLTEARYLPARLVQTSPPPKGSQETLGTFAIIDLDLSRYDRIASRFVQEAAEAASFLKSGIATRNRRFNRLIDEIERVVLRSKAPILLMGPTGAGKSLLARRIYELKQAKHLVSGRLVEVNCATIRGDSAMSSLFGHVKGAFTGATGSRDGLLRAADGGVLFLDEIGELGLDEQAMLLRALEEKTFLPLGADREVASEFQLIAGTNRDLHEEVRKGSFRGDLFARINLWTWELPGLAERSEDIEPNLDYEIRQFAERTGQRARFNREARERFLAFATSSSTAWTGNFRDLNAAVTRMATLARGGRITTKDVQDEIGRLGRTWAAEGVSEESQVLSGFLGEEALEAIDAFDQVQLAYVIEVCRKSRSLSDAGRKLFAASRSRRSSTNDAARLRKYLARFRLDWSTVVGDGG